MDAGAADFDKSQRGMESVRRGVRRADVDLADHALMVRPFRPVRTGPDKAGAHSRARAPMRRPRCGPHRQSAGSGRETRGNSDCRSRRPDRRRTGRRRDCRSVAPGTLGRPDAPAARLQPGQFLRMGVVEREQGFGQRITVQNVGWRDRLQRLITHAFRPVFRIHPRERGGLTVACRDSKNKIREPGLDRGHARVSRIPYGVAPSASLKSDAKRPASVTQSQRQ